MPHILCGISFSRSAIIDSFERIEIERWKHEADRWEAHNYFQSPHWTRILCESFPGYKNASVILSGKDNQKILVPLIENAKAPGVSTWLSLPHGSQGGPVREKSAQGTLDWDCVRLFFDKHKVLPVMINLLPNCAPPQWDDFKQIEMQTQILNLSQDFEQIAKSFSDNCRWSIRKAQRDGVEVRQLEKQQELEQCLDLYSKSLERWEVDEGFPRSFLEALWDSPGVSYWGAELQDRLVSFAVILGHESHRYYWIGAMDFDAQKSKPTNLLLHRIIQNACEQGAKTFDMGSSGGIEGVFRFKKSFGAEAVPFWRVQRAGWLLGGYRKLRNLFSKE